MNVCEKGVSMVGDGGESFQVQLRGGIGVVADIPFGDFLGQHQESILSSFKQHFNVSDFGSEATSDTLIMGNDAVRFVCTPAGPMFDATINVNFKSGIPFEILSPFACVLQDVCEMMREDRTPEWVGLEVSAIITKPSPLFVNDVFLAPPSQCPEVQFFSNLDFRYPLQKKYSSTVDNKTICIVCMNYSRKGLNIELNFVQRKQSNAAGVFEYIAENGFLGKALALFVAAGAD